MVLHLLHLRHSTYWRDDNGTLSNLCRIPGNFTFHVISYWQPIGETHRIYYNPYLLQIFQKNHTITVIQLLVSQLGQTKSKELIWHTKLHSKSFVPQFARTTQWAPSSHFTTGPITHFYRHVHTLVCLKQIWKPDYFPQVCFIFLSSCTTGQLLAKLKNENKNNENHKFFHLLLIPKATNLYFWFLQITLQIACYTK